MAAAIFDEIAECSISRSRKSRLCHGVLVFECIVEQVVLKCAVHLSRLSKLTQMAKDIFWIGSWPGARPKLNQTDVLLNK